MNPGLPTKRKAVLPPMARGRDNGSAILLGLGDYRVVEVWGGEEKMVVERKVKAIRECPYCT